MKTVTSRRITNGKAGLSMISTGSGFLKNQIITEACSVKGQHQSRRDNIKGEADGLVDK